MRRPERRGPVRISATVRRLPSDRPVSRSKPRISFSWQPIRMCSSRSRGPDRGLEGSALRHARLPPRRSPYRTASKDAKKTRSGSSSPGCAMSAPTFQRQPADRLAEHVLALARSQLQQDLLAAGQAGQAKHAVPPARQRIGVEGDRVEGRQSSLPGKGLLHRLPGPGRLAGYDLPGAGRIPGSGIQHGWISGRIDAERAELHDRPLTAVLSSSGRRE